MLFLDVNICVHAIRSTESGRIETWLSDRVNGTEPIGVTEFVLAAMTRIVTQRRIFADPSTPEDCVRFGNALLDAPAVSAVRPGARHWSIFGELVTTHRLRGNDVPDAYLAAIAMEHGATFVTLDRAFARFPGLRTLDPLA
ncbi:TA system VapC family ribonuclease toxin [Solicola gregarius]|uniref:Ribonuclease VapC n=1 Tax=Solicola gregarius TaxID=2908642 RepID=A0AA46YJS8_9ACTN|nr:TA system VapC family ribonuclease toxin [Solicola gregarius]UYM03821.1 PIN domain-containing protein [Solicola gregarius]